MECKYYYDLSAKKWWKLDTNLSDWTPITNEKAIELQLDNQLENTFQNISIQSESIDNSINNTNSLSKEGLTTQEYNPPHSTTITESIKLLLKDSKKSEININNNNSNNDTLNDSPAKSLEHGDRTRGRQMSYVREAARRLTLKDPGGFSGCIKVIADARNEMLKDADNLNFEIEGNKSSLNYMIDRAKKLAKSTSKPIAEIKAEKKAENTNLQKKLNKELKSPCYSDGDFSTEDSSDSSSTDMESGDVAKQETHDNSTTTASLSQLMAIKMKLKSKIKNLNK